jgi:hypothetical protein
MPTPSPRISPRPVLALAALLAAVWLLFAAAQQSSAAPASNGVHRQCQHPLVTGQEAINVEGISSREACRVVRSLARFMATGNGKSSPLFRCAGGNRNHPGRPVLKIHAFEGWSLKVVHEYGFKMIRGRASFEVTGQDFPLNCS